MESMWSKSAGAWRQVYPTPSVPTTVVLTAGEGASGVANLSWTASTVEYTTVASYELDQDGVVSDVGNVLLKQVTGLSDGTAYAFKVRAVAAFTGERGAWSNVVSVTPAVPWNTATGGLEQMVSNYNGTGQRWMVHTFTGNGTFTVTRGMQPFRVLVVGGGGNGHPGGGCGPENGGGGGGGASKFNDAMTIAKGAHSATVAGSQGTSTFLGLSAQGGGPGGNSWYNTNGSYCSHGAEGANYGPHSSTITGAVTSYGVGRGSGYSPGPPSGYGGGGGGGNTAVSGGGVTTYPGNKGVVIVAYRVG